MITTTLTGSAQKERNLIPIENAQGGPGSKSSWARAGSSDPKPTAKNPSRSRAGSKKGTQFGWCVLGFSALFAKLPIQVPYGRRLALLMDFPSLHSLGEQMLWVRPAAINFWKIILSD